MQTGVYWRLLQDNTHDGAEKVRAEQRIILWAEDQGNVAIAWPYDDRMLPIPCPL